jgi:nucleoside-diphosphate-sugar epimerase
MPKILVTRGAGFIGSHVVDLCLEGLGKTASYFRDSEMVRNYS